MSRSTSPSYIFGEGKNITGNSQLSTRNQQAYDELTSLKSNNRDKAIADQSREYGIREGIDAASPHIQDLLAQNSQYRDILEGSTQDIDYQRNTDRALERYNNTGLLDEVNQRIPPSKGQQPQPQYAEESAALENELVEEAQQSAFIKAQDMGDTSEENMNTLLIQELETRGIQ
jgi:hypothetical protein